MLHAVADRLEFRVRPPPGPAARIAEVAPDAIEEIDVLGSAPQVPIRAPCIAGFVVAMRRVVGHPRIARRTSDRARPPTTNCSAGIAAQNSNTRLSAVGSRVSIPHAAPAAAL